MEHYIKKSALVSEIEKTQKKLNIDDIGGRSVMAWSENFKNFIDTLEVKEVDLEKHLKEDIEDVLFDLDGVAVKGATHYLTVEDVKDIAKHFFELGRAVSNPITAADRGTAEEIITNLKRVEQDYRVNLTKEIEWLRNKVKKGEEV